MTEAPRADAVPREHKATAPRSIGCFVLTISDSKTPETDTSGILIGRRGQTLDALEYLVNRIVARSDGQSERIVVDSEDYRIRRRESLEDLARRTAARVAAQVRSAVESATVAVQRGRMTPGEGAQVLRAASEAMLTASGADAATFCPR